MSLLILEAGPLATIQDRGRPRLGRFGVPTSGPMDWFAFRAANGLVGNAETAAALETGLSDLVLQATEEMVVAVTGLGYEVWIQERQRPLWMTLRLKRGWTLTLRKTGGGGWAYVGVGGGIKAPLVLGARATYVRGGFGGLDGGPLRGAGALEIESLDQPVRTTIREIPMPDRLAYSDPTTVEVILGPQAERFTEAGVQTFFESTYQVTATSDRMGYRLGGAGLEHVGGADIVSDGMVMGSVQVPANGQPMVMMADGPTTGGYPKIATVITADLPLVAQCTPGQGRIRFKATTVEAAQTKYRGLMEKLRTRLNEPEEPAVIGW
jgi:antagonist of KipI